MPQKKPASIPKKKIYSRSRSTASVRKSVATGPRKVAVTKVTATKGKPEIVKGAEVKGNADNRIFKAVEKVTFRSTNQIGEVIKKSKYKPVELAPAFQMTYRTNKARAQKMAAAYAVTLPSINEHRELFMSAALMAKNERKTLIQGYRDAGQARGVVHAISQLPRAQARQIMNDFVIRDDKTKDEDSMREVMFWIRDAGKKMRDLSQGKKPDETTDDAVVEFFEDVGDAISDAVTAVVDAIVDVAETIGEAIKDVVNWVAEEVNNLVYALIEAGKTIFELVKAALETGYELVKKMIAGMIAIGKAMWEVLEEVYTLTKEALATVLKAIDNLGHQLGELLQWLAAKAYDVVKKFVEVLIEAGKSIGNILEKALEFGYTLIRNSVQALIALGKTALVILQAAFTRPESLFDEVVKALKDLGNTIGNLFDEVIDAGADLVKQIAESAARIGTSVAEFMAYAASAAADVVKKIVQGLIAAGKTVVDMLVDIAEQGISAIKKIVKAVFELGKTLIGLMKDVWNLGMDLLKDIVKAAFQLGKTIIDFTKSLVEFSYKVAARFIEAALAAGQTVAAMLESVVTSSYYVFRKIVNGILQTLGPVGDVLDWLLTRGEDFASGLWRETVMAIHFVKKSVTEILDWARTKTDEVFDTILKSIEDIGTALYDVIEWAQSVGDTALELLGEATVRVGNSVSYLLNYLEKDFIPGIAKIVQGVLNAGYAIVDIVAWVAQRGIAITVEVVKGAFEAGVTLATLITETVKHPSKALENLMKAATDLGKTMKDIFQVVIVETGEQFMDEVVPALVQIGSSIGGMLEGVLEIAGGAIGTVIAILFEMLGTYRPLTAQEKADAQVVFADSIDLDQTFIAKEGALNSIVFGVQDFFSQLFAGNFSELTDETDSRAFVTGNLINFDVDEDFDRPTLIHELTHVWQNQNKGPVYLAHAVAGQIAEGYNYGYNENGGDISISVPNAYYDGRSETYSQGFIIGEGGKEELENAAGDFDSFNPEQQGQIAMHYFVRRVLLGQTATEYAPWQTYADVLQAGVA